MTSFYEGVKEIFEDRRKKVNSLGVGDAAFHDVYMAHFATNPFYVSLMVKLQDYYSETIDLITLRAFLLDKGIGKLTFQKLKEKDEEYQKYPANVKLGQELDYLKLQLNKELDGFITKARNLRELLPGTHDLDLYLKSWERVKLFFGWNPIEGWTSATLYRAPLNLAKILLVIPILFSGIAQKMGDRLYELDKATGNTGFFKAVAMVPYTLQRVFLGINLFLRAGLSERESRGEFFRLGWAGVGIHYISMIGSRSLMLGPLFMVGLASAGVSVGVSSASTVLQALGPVWTNVLGPAFHTFGGAAKSLFSAIGVQIPQAAAVVGSGIGLMASTRSTIATVYRSAKKLLSGKETNAKKESETNEKFLRRLYSDQNNVVRESDFLKNSRGRRSTLPQQPSITASSEKSAVSFLNNRNSNSNNSASTIGSVPRLSSKSSYSKIYEKLEKEDNFLAQPSSEDNFLDDKPPSLDRSFSSDSTEKWGRTFSYSAGLQRKNDKRFYWLVDAIEIEERNDASEQEEEETEEGLTTPRSSISP